MEHKTFAITNYAFKADGDGPGELTGYGSTFGNVDQGGDVILRGAFEAALPDFLYRGFVPIGHDWMGLPVASIADAKEDDNGLFFRAEFHSTPAAQEARTVVRERLERGKFVGLSIGFLPDYDEGVSVREDGVRVISKIKELAEVSIVTVPMNRLAGVDVAKSDDGRPVSSLPLLDHAEWVLARTGELIERSHDKSAYRLKEGRTLSAANRTRLAGISEQMREAAQSLDGILAETDPDREKLQLEAERKRRLLLQDVDMLLAGAW